MTARYTQQRCRQQTNRRKRLANTSNKHATDCCTCLRCRCRNCDEAATQATEDGDQLVGKADDRQQPEATELVVNLGKTVTIILEKSGQLLERAAGAVGVTLDLA